MSASATARRYPATMRAVFLDRDDTLIENATVTKDTPHPGDLLDPDLVTPLAGAAAACARLRDAGYLLIVVTNQAGVAEGLCPPEKIEAVNDRMREVFLAAPAGVRFDAVYYSPFLVTGSVRRFTVRCDTPGGLHAWRKPRPGMIRAAADEFGVDLRRSWMVGDAPRDIEAGTAAGIPPDRCLRIGEAAPFADLAAAAAHILAAP